MRGILLSILLATFLVNGSARAQSVFGYKSVATWQDEEVRLVETMIQNFQSKGLGEFFNKIQAKGYKEIRRHRHHSKDAGRAQTDRVNEFAYVAWVNENERSVNVTDRFFETSFKDSSGSFEVREAVLFHELVHAFFTEEPELLAELLEVAEFEALKESLQPGSVNASIYFGASFEMQMTDALKNNRERDQAMYEISRKYARLLGAPTLYSFRNADEFAAELVTYVLLDPSARDYVAAPVREWIETMILQ